MDCLDWALALALNGSPECRTALNQRLSEWIARNRSGPTNGWKAVPLSIRIVNLAYILSMPRTVAARHAEPMKIVLVSQVRALVRKIETALQGNHLIKYGKALLVAGLAHAGEEADAWFQRGLELLDREMEIQVCPDGGHTDRSPMYQIQALLDYMESLHLLKASRRPVPGVWTRRLRGMAGFADACTHPDGLSALLGDTSLAGLPPKRQLLSFARELGIKPNLLTRQAAHGFPDSAYVVARDLNLGNYLIVDAGAEGDPLDAAHYHCQLFSYELSLEGRRIITDTGVFAFEAGADRTYCRSSAAHNTISWGTREPSEIQGAFRLARRAQILHRKVSPAASGGLRLEARMKGFYRGSEWGSWQRELRWAGRGILDIVDTWLHPRPARGLVTRIHFAPGLTLVAEGEGEWGIYLSRGPKVASLQVFAGKAALTTTDYYPSFGERIARSCLEISLVADEARYRVFPHA